MSVHPARTVLGIMLVTVAAKAEPDPAALARAEVLFEEGKRLLEQARYDEACPKLEESLRIDEGGGTLAALAVCHHRQGKTATAWGEFKMLLALANRTGHADRKKLAETAIAELEPKLSKVILRVSPEAKGQVDLVVRLDGAAVGKASWQTPLPVNPGEHTVEATAPGRVPWRLSFELGARADAQEVLVPPLLVEEPTRTPLAPASSPPVEQPMPARSVSATQPEVRVPGPGPATARRTAAWATGGAGALSLLVGGVYGVMAVLHQREANRACEARVCSDAAAVQASKDAQREGWVANAGVGLGVAGLLAAYWLMPPALKGVSPQASRSGSGLLWRGEF